MDKKKGKRPVKKEEKPVAVPDQSAASPADREPESAPAAAGRATMLRIAAILLAVVVLAVAVFYGSQLLWSSSGQPVTVYYFYGDGCEFCSETTPYVLSLHEKYPEVDFRILEVWYNPANNATLNAVNKRVGQQKLAVPEAVVGDVVLLGDRDILTKLESTILAQKKNLTDKSLPAAGPVGTGAPVAAPITATLFYGNGCSHCESVKPLIADLQVKYPELQIVSWEINDNKQNREKFLDMQLAAGMGTVGSIPTIFIGDSVLVGESEVRDHFEEKILLERQKRGTGTPVTPAPGSQPVVSNVSLGAVYFYGDNCVHCENLKPVIANITSRYPALNLTRLEINHNAENRQKIIDMSSRYGIPNPGVPVIFIGDSVLIGEAEITTGFEAAILAERTRVATGAPANQTPGISTGPVTPALSPYMVVFAALIDSTNPCGLSVLVFLLISMAAAGGRRRILLVGGVYIAAMFLFHLLVGIGLFSAMAISGWAKPFSIIGGAVALVLGIVTLVDVLRNKETFLLSIPESRKGLLGDYARKATLPAAFILGILAGVLGFSCTGGIYISILGLMGRDMTVMTGLPYLVLYNLIFVLPLVLVTLLVAYGLSPERAERWRTENKHTIRLVIGVILVALGLVILLGWFG